MKKIFVVLFALIAIFTFAACDDNSGSETNPPNNGTNITITVGTDSFASTLADNETARAFKEKLPMTLDMSEMNGNEKYNYLSENLPTDSSRAGIIHEGDIMLYGSNCVVLFYETFSSSYSYTRIGWINDTAKLKSALGGGNVTVTFSLNENEQPIVVAQDFTFNKEGNTYTVTDYTGNDTNIAIPNEYDGLPVTKIQGEYGTGAFARKDIVSVTIPDTITEIGQNSFYNCSLLQTVIIGQNSNLNKIGNNAFSGNSALKNIYIPAKMTELGNAVFNNCGALESITVAPDNPAYRSENGHLIERETQTLIRGVNNGIVPEGVKVLAQAAFRRANTITELNIPKTVESIENYAFADSAIEKINFTGTMVEWNQIQKANMWNYGKEDLQVSYYTTEPSNPDIPDDDEKEITVMYLYINENKIEVTLAENRAVSALIDILKQGDITYTANDYGGFEKVGSLGHFLPTENSQITTQAGDVILYSVNQIVLFYDSNSWSYTRLGKINGYSIAELRTLLCAGSGSVQVRISLKSIFRSVLWKH